MLKRGLSQPGRYARQAALSSTLALLTACGGDFFKKPDGMGSSSSVPVSSSSSQESSSSEVSSSVPISSSSSSSPQSGGEAFKLTIQSEDFARFSDTTDAQEGTCGDGPVDMGQAKPGQPGTCDVGWTNAGEWLDFDFNMPEAGVFTIGLGLGSDVADRTVEILVNGQSMGSLNVPQIGWEAFEEMTLTDIPVDAGATTLRVLFTTGATNFDYVRLEQTDFVPQSSSSSSESSSSSSSSSIPPVEDDDSDGVANDADLCPDTQGVTLFTTLSGKAVYFSKPMQFDDPGIGDLYRHEIFVSQSVTDLNFVADEATLNNGHGPFNTIGREAQVLATIAGENISWFCEVGADCDYERSDYYALMVDEAGLPVGPAADIIQSAEFDYMPATGHVDLQGCSAAQLDGDADGVSDDLDVCPSTPNGEAPVKDGCAIFELDSDFDGVDDSLDQCPESFESDVDAEGCAAYQLDSDDDGVSDDLDQCPDTEANKDVDAVGCADNQLDGDNDGVDNTLDACPNTPSNEDVDGTGCAESQKDDDNDGVFNNVDSCENTPESEQADAEGCSDSQKDSDNDGVVDSLDQCPNTAANDVADENGCGLIQTDVDGDGVDNEVDLCPSTPSGEDADANGCSESQKDDDNDGVMNDSDQCAATPNGQPVDASGCADSQKDTDADGVNDDTDQCPATPTNENADANGCSESQKDSDGDGVSDQLDTCPATPNGESPDANGCSDSQKDGDSDGVMDNIDQCPGTPVGADVDSQGCGPTQTDGDDDGVSNAQDQCPNTPTNEQADANGCSDSQKDDDADGVMNNVDTCPATPSGEQADANGCSDSQKDSDNDGVMDALDQCDATPSGEQADNSGCSDSQKDDDADGVMNNLDTCPATPVGEQSDANGCSDSQKDDDVDGVMNNADSCPATPSGEQADVNGCSESQKDSDNDGVMDDVDQCDLTPSGEQADASGCSDSQKDSDNDGVMDNADQCDATPSNEQADASGCSESQKDADNDGVNNNLDLCPNTPAGASVDNDGCAETQKDGDDDGVSDAADQCPGTPANELPDANGCSDSQKDSDADGVNDLLDQCPGSVGPVNAAGCAADQRDADADGVSDANDLCSDTPSSEQAGPDGCSVSQIDAVTLFDGTCKGCHGAQGEGASNAPVFGKTADDLRAIITSNATMGIVGGNLTDPQIEALGILMSDFPVPDSDGDGVSDPSDLCPSSASNLSVDVDGCDANQLVGDPVAGAQAWADSGCSGCHGNFASQQGVNRAIDPANLTATSIGQIGGFIELNMQYIGTCVGQCAADAAAFVLTLEPQPDATNGKALYADSCAGCHGEIREGSSLFPELSGETIRGKYSEFQVLVDKVSQMSGQYAQSLTGSDHADIAAFLETDGPSATNGQALYSNCAGCHGDKRQGSGAYPSLFSDSIDANFASFGELVTKVQQMNAFTGNALAGTADIEDVAAFLWSDLGQGDASVGQDLFLTGSCSGCHGDARQGMGSFPELSGATIRSKYPAFSNLVTKVIDMGAPSASDAVDIARFLTQD